MGHLPALIAFDLDGTLIDSSRDLADSANELIAELGGTPLSEEAVASMVGEGAALLVQRALTAAGRPHPPDAVARFLAIYDTRLLNHTRLYDGVAEALDEVHGRARLTVLTNKPLAPTERILTSLGLRDRFAEVFGGDRPYPRKPDPSGLLTMMARAGVREARTLMVGDSFVDHQTAVRAGVRSCIVSYGFGFQRFDRSRLRAEDWLADDVAGLRAAMRAFLDAPSSEV